VLQKSVTQNSAQPDERVEGLYSDVSGRISKSVSTVERFKRWGEHYLRAIVRAHQLQFCTNFMDAGLQIYGGTGFKRLEYDGGKVFTTLPLKKRADYEHLRRGYTPTPATTNTTTASVSGAAAPAPPVDNSYLYAGSGGGCFDASCVVNILPQNPSGNTEEISTNIVDVRKGDLVAVADENGKRDFATVQCLVKIERNTKSDDLVEFKKSGLKLTPSHPLRIDGVWYKPKSLLGKDDVVTCKSTTNYVYNLVLDRNHVLLYVNDVECTTFGHGFDDKVAWHPFYASRDVVNVVETLPGFSDGFVETTGSLKKPTSPDIHGRT